MGLDSVELLVETENFFRISIPDRDAEEIFTVQDFAETVSKYVKFSFSDIDLKTNIFNKIKLQVNQHFEISEDSISLNHNIEDVFQIENRKIIWETLQNNLGFSIPELSKSDLKNFDKTKRETFIRAALNKIFVGKPILKGRKFSDLVDWVISQNYRKLINPNEIHNIYEIQRAIVGIISEKMGIDLESIELKHRIVKDLGID